MSGAGRQATAAVALALMLAVPAWPQSPGAACDALPADADKLRCFSEIVSELEARLARDDDASTAPTDRGEPGVPGAVASSRPISASPAPVAAAPGSAATAKPVANAANSTTAGAPAGDDGEAAEGIEIVEIWQGPLGGLTVRLANGEVWRQLDSDNTRLVLPGGTTRYAVIEEGFLGSRRLKILGSARSFRVRRID